MIDLFIIQPFLPERWFGVTNNEYTTLVVLALSSVRSETGSMLNNDDKAYMIRKLAAYLLAVIVAYILASITATQSVIAQLAELGIEVNFVDRLIMTMQDIAGMAGMFLPMIAAAFLLAFLVAALLCRWIGRKPIVLYVLAGAVALIAIHLTLYLAFGIMPLAIAKTTGGLLIQGLAGAVGAYLYAYMNRWT